MQLDPFSEINGDLIVSLAAQYRVPAGLRHQPVRQAEAPLMSYGPNLAGRRQPRDESYVDRMFARLKSRPSCRCRRPSSSISWST